MIFNFLSSLCCLQFCYLDRLEISILQDKSLQTYFTYFSPTQQLTIVIQLLFQYILILDINKVWKFSKLARNFLFNAGAENSFDMGLGGPKGYMVRFFSHSVDFFSKLHPLIRSSAKASPKHVDIHS